MGDFVWVGHELAEFGGREPAGGGDLDGIDGDFGVTWDDASEDRNKIIESTELIPYCTASFSNES